MRRLVALGVVLIGLSFAGGVPPSQVFTDPSAPPQELLDRLNLTTEWRTLLPVGGLQNGITQVQHADGQIFIRTRDGTIHALEAATGHVTWSAQVGKPYPVVRRLGFNRESVLVIEAARIVALERATGRQRWEIEVPEVPITPVAAGDLLMYLNFSRGRVNTYALPETTEALLSKSKDERLRIAEKLGQLRAKISAVAPVAARVVDPRAAGPTVPGQRGVSPVEFAPRTGTTLPVRGRFALTGDLGPTQIDALAAQPQFLSSRTPGFPVNHPVVVGPVGLIVSGSSTKVLVLRYDLENPIYEFDLNQAPAVPALQPIVPPIQPIQLAMPPVQTDEVSYFVTTDWVVHAINLRTKQTLWRYAVASTITDPPVVAGDSLYLVSERSGLTRLNRATGQPVWSEPTAKAFDAANSHFVYADDRIGRLLVLDRARGTILGETDLSEFNIPFANDQTDRLILSANNGLVISLRDKSFPGPVRWAPPPFSAKAALKAAVEKSKSKSKS